MTPEKQVNYQATNTYSTLNTYSGKTKNIWFACHGIGYLSAYFIKYFDHLDPETNYIVAPQAPAKYYQDKSYKYIGASWFTRKNLEEETQNVVNYLDAVFASEIKPKLKTGNKLILFGYSQGVSAITRWLAQSHINCDTLLLHSGGLPKELNVTDFNHLTKTEIILAYGDQDEYLTEERMKTELKIYTSNFGQNFKIQQFKGKHEINRAILQETS